MDSTISEIFCNTPKSGYRFLCCYSFLTFLSRIFPLEFGKWPGISNQSSTSQCLAHALEKVKPPSVNPEPHSNPSSELLELEILPLCLQRSHHFPCSFNPPKISRDPLSLINPRCAKILLSHMQYFSSRINSFFLPFWGIKSGKIYIHLHRSWKLVEIFFVIILSSHKNIGHN